MSDVSCVEPSSVADFSCSSIFGSVTAEQRKADVAKYEHSEYTMAPNPYEVTRGLIRCFPSLDHDVQQEAGSTRSHEYGDSKV